MEKILMKFAFLVFLVKFIYINILVLVTVLNVEAKHLSPEENPQSMLHHEASLHVVKPQGHCKKGCRVICIPNQQFIRCICLC
ncbi:hypothetical protein EUTSA_v10027499mg [Eutrema salsugineum]|uniref:Uncharacterized protein n=1 Tax=Eutrema salsugineum TaxID=72664 RepID=V4P8Z1_EUTSA|nr:hypothetical protein EUTSA_v10027499mg [Eutrema salsugineum]